MRVVLYTDAVELGGAEISLRHLAASLDEQLSVTVLGTAREIVTAVASARAGAVPNIVRGQSGPLDARCLTAHVRALRALRPAVLHCNLWSPWSCQYAVAAALAVPSTRVVAVYQLPVPAANELQRTLKRLTSARVAAHVGVGRRTAREVEELIPLRAGSVRTIHNGVPAGAPPPKRRRRSGALTIGALGRLEPQKGLDLLIEALPVLPDARLRIIGDGRARPELEQLAAHRGVAERVAWSGWTSDPRTELSQLDVFVQPSRFEGFPLAVLEAMLAELPVVATDVGSVSDAVISGVTGMLAPAEDPPALADAIATLLADEAARERLGRQARAHVLEHFTAAAMAASYESLYREIVA